ncbi:hypothetical protein M6D93_02080 [Jatrophihabitans telluris]|uniref:C2H2-type domain-containing protein n=1 Tax=Jatrophihabitans telluris TaxID=2038343 RepID=A0ABY4R110_9ACTN|nr:hypothetical protein [Jatrophihabitans telluris]UQX88801.1 hypothetical protein M6D93_02080 [Jatrophihabitans telluris]
MTDGPYRRNANEPSEARCALCGETFILADPNDLMHFQRRDGELCGGDGVPFRKYIIRRPNRI